MFIWSLKGFCSNMFPSGGAFDPLKWGQNEDVKGEAEDFKSATIEFYGSNIVYYDSFDVFKAILAKSLHRNALCFPCTGGGGSYEGGAPYTPSTLG